MAGASTYLAQALLGHFLRAQAYTPPSNVYLALGVADFTAGNLTANEVTGTWYSRQALSGWTAPTGSGMSTSSSNALSFSAVQNNALTVGYWGLYDAPVGGNLLFYGAFDAPKTLNVNNIPRVKAGELTVSFGGMFSVYLAQAAINLVLRGTSFTPPTPCLALYTADPTAADITANEVSAAWYGRQSIASWSAPTGTANSSSNLAAFAFNEVTGAQAVVSHWALRDALTGGNLLFSKALPTVETLNVEDDFTGNAGDLTVQIL